MGVVDAVELIHSVKHYNDNTHSTELVSAFFIANLGCDKAYMNKVFEKLIAYTECDFLILDQALLYPSQDEIEKIAIKLNLKKVPVIGNCFAHVTALITRDFMQSRLTWHGNQSKIACELNFDLFGQNVMKMKPSLKRDWAVKVLMSFEAMKGLQLDLKYGAWLELCSGPAIPFLAAALKRSNAESEGLTDNEFIHIKSCLKALNLLCECTRIIEDMECSFGYGKRELDEVIKNLTVLSFTIGTAKNSRETPTTNLVTAYKTFLEIKSKVPNFKLKMQSIITHYRLRGDLRACANGLVPSVKVFIEKNKFYLIKKA